MSRGHCIKVFAAYAVSGVVLTVVAAWGIETMGWGPAVVMSDSSESPREGRWGWPCKVDCPHPPAHRSLSKSYCRLEWLYSYNAPLTPTARDTEDRYSRRVHQLQVGWPFPSLERYWINGTDAQGNAISTLRVGEIGLADRVFVSYLPIPVGFSASSICFATVVGMMHWTALGVRRFLRSRKFACTVCGYPRSPDFLRCPECGTAYGS